ncbi:hypothetical protein [Paraburkholderia nodosa]|uniref:hypothetical protein n=1 Tax=Paraburkholderia nodosa TaxID=392320 RepID=UPI0004816DA7|nr:hypothetical protein [Paraburkholderia nodosa]
MTDLDARVDVTAALLRRWLIENGFPTLPDDSVSEPVASLLCGYKSRGALARRIDEGLSVPRYRTVGRRRYYALRDIAAWLEGGYEA